jgi:hypothetical protein
MEGFVEYIDGLKQARAALVPFIEEMALVIPEEGLRDIVHRHTEEGKSATGQTHKQYTVAYLKKKQKAGKYKGFVDLQYSTRMWAGTGVVGKETSEDGFLVTIAGKNVETQTKLDANSERYGDLLELSTEEIDNLAARFDNELQRFINKYLPEQ